MGRVVVFPQLHSVSFDDYDDRALAENDVRLRTLYSGISAGTQLTAYRGSNPYMHKRWDEPRRLFVAAETSSQSYPMSGWGYEEVGRGHRAWGCRHTYSESYYKIQRLHRQKLGRWR